MQLSYDAFHFEVSSGGVVTFVHSFDIDPRTGTRHRPKDRLFQVLPYIRRLRGTLHQARFSVRTWAWSTRTCCACHCLRSTFVSSTGNLNIITSDHVKPEFASSEQGVDVCFLVHASVWQLDWERLLSGVAFIEGRSVDFSAKRGRTSRRTRSSISCSVVRPQTRPSSFAPMPLGRSTSHNPCGLLFRQWMHVHTSVLVPFGRASFTQ